MSCCDPRGCGERSSPASPHLALLIGLDDLGRRDVQRRRPAAPEAIGVDADQEAGWAAWVEILRPAELRTMAVGYLQRALALNAPVEVSRSDQM
jgi:hypothetical protein